jgi:hypothetical protein
MVFIILFCNLYRHYSPRTSAIFVSEYMASLSLSFTIERALAGMRNSPIFRNGPRIWSTLLAHQNISYGSHTAKNLLDKLLSVPGGVLVSASRKYVAFAATCMLIRPTPAPAHLLEIMLV